MGRARRRITFFGRTGYWGFALFALHGVRNMGKKTGYASARTFLVENYGCSNECCLCQNIWLRIIETSSKRMCSSTSVHPLVAASRSFCRRYLHTSTHVHIPSSIKGKRKRDNSSLQNRPFIVVTSCLITVPSPTPLPKAKPSAITQPHPTSILRARRQ